MLAPSQRFLFVDGLRGLAALSVALFHIGNDFLGIPLLAYFGHGVTVFFVLSGFVIAHSLEHKQISPMFFARFTLRRALRLDPAYWAAILCAVLIMWVPAVLLGYAVELPRASNVALHMFYLQEFAQAPAINTVFWTLCYEIQFYLVFCALLGLSQTVFASVKKGVMIFFIACLAISLLWPLGVQAQIVHGLFIDLWFLFLLGVFARWAVQDKMALSALLLAVLVLLLFTQPEAQNYIITIIGVSTALLLFTAGKLQTMAAWLRWRWVQYLGMISYSLYLLHDMLGVYIRDTGRHLSAKYLDLSSMPVDYLWCAIALAASIAAAHLMHRYIEAPSHRLSRRIKL